MIDAVKEFEAGLSETQMAHWQRIGRDVYHQLIRAGEHPAIDGEMTTEDCLIQALRVCCDSVAIESTT